MRTLSVLFAVAGLIMLAFAFMEANDETRHATIAGHHQFNDDYAPGATADTLARIEANTDNGSRSAFLGGLLSFIASGVFALASRVKDATYMLRQISLQLPPATAEAMPREKSFFERFGRAAGKKLARPEPRGFDVVAPAADVPHKSQPRAAVPHKAAK